MHRRLFLALAMAGSASTGAAFARQAPNFTANDVLEKVIPTAPIGEWTEAPGRRTVSLERDGAVLRGWRYAGGVRGGPSLLVFGGSNNLIRNHDAAYRGLAAGVGEVLAYDYRGFGFSTGRADAMDLRRDAVALVDLAAKPRGLRHVMVLGYSMGSMMAGYAAGQRAVGGLVLLAGLSNPQLMAQLYPQRLAGLVPSSDALDFLDVTASVRRSRSPLLIIHGDQDQAVRIEEGRANLQASASVRKKMVELQGVGHDDLLASPAVQAAVAEFARRV